MIEIEGLVRKYGGKVAVDGIDLRLNRGVFYTFLGPNGAGKTTTMKVMAGLLRPTAGRVRIDGIDVVEHPVEAKRRIGYIPDHPFLYDRLTGWEFLCFIGGLYSMPREAVRARGEELLATFGLTDEAGAMIESYSHGMRQRLAFCACFIHDPRVVIVDEPWVGLDPRNIRTAIEFLKRRAAEGVTIFMSTHSLDIAEDIAERIGIIHQGRLLYDGTLEQLRAAENNGGANGGASARLEEIFLEMTE
jgi:ABC-2 type transport system ATP-binding protein